MLKDKINYKLKCMSLFTALKIYKGDIEIIMKDQWSIKTRRKVNFLKIRYLRF